MTSEVDLCNRALATIGTRSTISSIQPSDGSNEANQCALLYYPVRDALLRSAHWDFARRQVSLSQLKAASDTNSTCPVPWQFEYAYPSDCLKCRFLLPSYTNLGQSGGGVPLTALPNTVMPGSDGGNRRPIRFFVGSDIDQDENDITIILTNQPQALMVYTHRITNPDLMDAQFQEALVAALAAKLVPALALNLALMKGQIEIASTLINEARITNGNEGPQMLDLTPDWIRVREGYGTFAYGYDYLGWDAFPWPSSL